MDAFVESVIVAAKKHPALRMSRRHLAMAALFGIMAVALLEVSAPIGASVVALFIALFAWTGMTLRVATPLGALSRANDLGERRDHARAELLIGFAESTSKGKSIRRLAASLRAARSLDMGDARTAEAHATRGLEVRKGLLEFDTAPMQRADLYAVRALARALAGNDEVALDDAKRACASEAHCIPSVWAKAELARAVVAASKNRKDEVLEVLARSRPFFDAPSAHKRNLVRTLTTFARDRKRSVYRHPAKPGEEDPIDAMRARNEPAQITFPETPAAPVTRAGVSNQAKRTLGLWVFLILVFLAIWQMLNPHDPHPQPTPSPSLWPLGASIVVIFMTAFLTLTVWGVRRGSSDRSALRRATLGALRGDKEAFMVLERLAKRRSPPATLALATLAERAGDFEYALGRCDDGIAWTNASQAAQVNSFDVIAPALHAERAFCLAALGRYVEAEASLASITNANDPSATTARFRVSLASALTRGDREAARDLARTYSATIAMPLRDALLVDMLEANIDDDWAYIHAELKSDPALEKWVNHFLPNAKARKPAITPRVQVAEEHEEHEELSEVARATEQ